MYVEYGRPFGDVFPQVKNPKDYRVLVWKDTDGNYYDEDSIVSTKENLVLIPEWGSPDEYLVIFYGNGSLSGSMKPIHCWYDKDKPWPAVKFDNGDGFEGWSKTPDRTLGDTFITKFDTEAPIRNLVDRDTGHIKLYAMWDETRTVTYYDPFRDKEIYSERLTHAYTAKGTKEFPSLEFEGLRLVGWTQHSSYTGVIDDEVFIKVNGTRTSDGKNDWLLYPIYEIIETGKYALFFYDPDNDSVKVLFTSENDQSFTFPNIEYNVSMRDLSYWTTEKKFDENHPPQEDHRYYPGNAYDVRPLLWDTLFCSFTAVSNYSVEIKFDYNYGGDPIKDIEVIIPKSEYYTLPTPTRRGYLFGGWGQYPQYANDSNGGEPTYEYVFDGGYSFKVPRYGAELYAIWKPLSFTIEYYDGFTGQLIGMPEEVNTRDNTVMSLPDMPGLMFEGWTLGKPTFGWSMAANKDKRYAPKFRYNSSAYPGGKSIMDLPFEKCDHGVLRLYSSYTYADGLYNASGVTVIYVANGGSKTPQPKSYGIVTSIPVGEGDMSRDGCSFAGWKVLCTNAQYSNRVYKPEDNIANHGFSFVLLIAEWDSERKFGIDPNYKGAEYIDLSEDYKPGDKFKIEELVSRVNRDGYYPRKWITSDGETYRVDQFYEVPNRDVTFYPDWEMKRFSIIYHSGFVAEEFVPIEVDGVARLTFELDQFQPWIYVDGYTFVGWTKISCAERGMPNVNIPEKDIIKNDLELKYLDSDLDVYACYTINKLPEGKIRFLYNDMGGYGGPGEVLYDDIEGQKFEISDIVPERKGFDFKCWETALGEYHPGDKFEEEIYDNEVFLNAVWIPETTNERKKWLQDMYGTDIMPDWYFECEYESSEWEKIDERTYFVIKTTNCGSSENAKWMVSDVMIIEYKCGKWWLYVTPSSARVKDLVKHEIATNFDDEEGRLYTAMADVGFMLAGKIPIAKTILDAQDVMGTCLNLANKWGTSKQYSEANRLADKLIKILYNDLKKGYEENADGVIIDKYKDDHYVADLMVKLYPIVRDWIQRGFEINKSDIVDGIKTIGNALITGSKNFDIEKIKYAFTHIGEKLNPELKAVIKQFDADHILGSTGNLIKWGFKNLGEDIRDYGDKEFDAIDSLLINGDNSLLDNVWSYIELDVATCVWSVFCDDLKYACSEKLDSFGNFNIGLQTFWSEAKTKQFNQTIINSFPGLLYDIYQTYYGLK